MMERLGITLEGAPSFGWHAVSVWARHLPEGSAVWRALHPEHAAFASELGRASIMADIFDAVLHTAATIAAAHGGKPRQPKPYPRPGARDRRSMGGGAIPVSSFDEWFYSED